MEIPLTLWAFGLRYYNPLSKDVPHSSKMPRCSINTATEISESPGFHLFDAFVIISSFILDVVLRGRERELAGLLILLRLWRLIKLVGGARHWLALSAPTHSPAGVAAGFDELTEELTYKLHRAEAEARAKTVELEAAKAEIAQLQAKLDSYQP